MTDASEEPHFCGRACVFTNRLAGNGIGRLSPGEASPFIRTAVRKPDKRGVLGLGADYSLQIHTQIRCYITDE